MAHCGLGALHLDLLALSQAREHLEQALSLSTKIGSLFWTYCVTGLLGSTYIQQRELLLAESLLSAETELATPLETMGQRLVGVARAELALAVGEPAQALQIADSLIASAVNLAPGQAIARLSKLRAEALAARQQTEEAETELQAALEAARAQGTRSLQWRIHNCLGSLYQALSRPEAAEPHLKAAQKIVGELAANIPDEALRREFVRRATLG